MQKPSLPPLGFNQSFGGERFTDMTKEQVHHDATYTEGDSVEIYADIDGRQSCWGNSIEKQWGTSRLDNGGFNVQGCMTPLPKVGQTVRLLDGVYRFTEVEPARNPPDLYYGQIEPVVIFKTRSNG